MFVIQPTIGLSKWDSDTHKNTPKIVKRLSHITNLHQSKSLVVFQYWTFQLTHDDDLRSSAMNWIFLLIIALLFLLFCTRLMINPIILFSFSSANVTSKN